MSCPRVDGHTAGVHLTFFFSDVGDEGEWVQAQALGADRVPSARWEP